MGMGEGRKCGWAFVVYNIITSFLVELYGAWHLGVLMHLNLKPQKGGRLAIL